MGEDNPQTQKARFRDSGTFSVDKTDGKTPRKPPQAEKNPIFYMTGGNHD